MLHDNKSNYMLLSRLVGDCKYFLGNGNRSVNSLWAGSVEEQISTMKELWNSFTKKPEWLTMEQIQEFEAQMTA